MKTFAVRLIQIGILFVSLAIVWWHSFYRVIAQQILPSLGESDPTVGTGLSCLYSTGGICNEFISAGESLGKTVYSPVVFWLGVVMLIAGVALSMVEKYRNQCQ